MDKKAFTLVEILAVIIILGVLSLVIFPSIVDKMKQTEKEVSDAMKKVIYSAAASHTSENGSGYIIKNGNIYCITLRDLVKDNYLKSPVIDPATSSELPLSTKIEIKIENGNYVYKINDSCAENIN